VEVWQQVEGLESNNSGGSINERGDPVLKGRAGAGFRSPSTTLGPEPDQYDCLTFTYVGGDVEVGVCGGDGDDDEASVDLQPGIVTLNSTISHDGEYHPPLTHNAAMFKPQSGQTVYFRVSRVEAGQFTFEMMVEGGPWGHLTPNGEPLLPKTKEGEAMEGMRVYVNLMNGGATVSDLRVGKQRKKPTKSANKRVQGVDAEGERAAVPRHYPSFSPFDAMLLSLSLSVFFICRFVACRSRHRCRGWWCIVNR
jgi:hypothetical protein